MIDKIIGNGKYKIIRQLGEGGMGVLYLAENISLGKRFAIKSLSPALTHDPRFRKRFYREAKEQALLEHPNIVQAIDFFEEDEQFFFVMQYVEGEDLGSVIKTRGKLTETEALPVFKQILDGLAFAHSEGVIHRDIKPANILIDRAGRPRITDFGIAILAGGKRMTTTGTAIGTPWYMSPEQIVRPKDVDATTDIYSAGVMLFEMLTGDVPFDGETEFVVKEQQVNAPPPDPRNRNPHLSPCLADVIMKAMAKAPENRFQHCSEFIMRLIDCAPELDKTAPHVFPSVLGADPGHADSRDSRSSRSLLAHLARALTPNRRPIVWGLSVLAVVAALGWLIAQNFPPDPAIDQPTEAPSQAGETKAPERPDKKELVSFRDTFPDGSEGPEMVMIPAGEFRMGDIQGLGAANEQPVHRVTIRQPFAISRTEITFEAYDLFVDTREKLRGPICRDEKGKEVPIKKPNDRNWGRGPRPVMGVSWNQARCYVRWLSDQTGNDYRLPSEAEWEYAARAGSQSAYYWGDAAEETGTYAWYGQNSEYKTRPVKQKQPNGFGLYDLFGNVYEWTADCWHDDYTNAPADGSAWLEADGGECSRRVLRGGSWDSNTKRVRSAARDWNLADDRFDDIGFRVVKGF